MQIDIFEFTHIPTKMWAIMFDGTKEQANILIKEGWLTGSDLGFGKENAGGIQLRGHIEVDGERRLVFRGDIIARNGAHHEVWERAAFDKEYSEPILIQTLTDAVDEPVRSPVPTGENPDAVNLEPDRGE